jgi:thiol:disulfide interchange protein DsbG
MKTYRFSFALVSSTLMLITPCAGAQNLPDPIKALQDQGLKVVGELPSVSGLKAYAGHMGQQPYALYVTPDGKHVLVGSIFDAQGKNLTQAPLEQAIAKPLSAQTLAQLEATSWVLDGKKDAARIVYVFTDPNCPYCHKFWEQARPWVSSGKVQLRHVMVGILRDTSPGKAAAILSAADPSAALAEHEKNMAAGGIKPLESIPTDQQVELLANQSLMAELGMQATPAIFFEDSDGLLRAKMGAPADTDLESILGPR